MSSRKQCSNEQPDCEWWKRTFFGPPGSPHHYMCTLPDERYRAECPIIQRRVTQEKLENIVKDKCCEKCDAYEPFCRDGCPVFIDEYENQCRKDEREKLLDEILKFSAAYSQGLPGFIYVYNLEEKIAELRQKAGE